MASDEHKILLKEQGGASAKPVKRRGMWRFFVFLVVLGGLAGGAYLYRDEPMVAKIAELVGMEDGAQPELHSAHQPSASQPPAKSEPEKAKAERKVLYHTCSMHPEIKSDKPGKCPICGMNLTPVYAEEESSSSEETQPAGAFKISPQRQQLIGVEYGEVRERPLSKVIRMVGRVSYDETRIAHIHTKTSGWIDKLHVDFTGKLVKKGQPLLTIYSPELVSTQQELLIAKKSRDFLGNSPFIKGVGSNAFSLYESTRERLKLWDIPESEIKEIERRGTPNKNLTLYSPINGFVLTRNGFSGHRVTPEMELYSIVDLSTIWVLADVYEYELPMISIGQTATMTLSYSPGKTFTGRVTYIYPGLEAATRTLKVRLEFSNAGYELKPDMYTNVEVKVDYGTQLAVPRDAVLDSGTDQVVFVAREGGYFEPRKVSLGQQVGDQVIVLAGIQSGERVVTSANFLVDSESQLKSALGSMAGGAHAGHGGEVPAGGKEKEKPPTPAGQAPTPAHGGVPTGTGKSPVAKPSGHEGHGG